jgi:hypothetical protein
MQSTYHTQQLNPMDTVYYVEVFTTDELHMLSNMYYARIKYKDLVYLSVEAARQAQKFEENDRVMFSEAGIFSDWGILSSQFFFGEKRGTEIMQSFQHKGMIGIIAKLVGLNDDISQRFHLRRLPETNFPKEEWMKLLWAKFSIEPLREVLLGNTTRHSPAKFGSRRSQLVKKGGYTGVELLLIFDGLHKDSETKIGYYGGHINENAIVLGHNVMGNYLMETRQLLKDYQRFVATSISDWDQDCEDTIGALFDEM